MSSVTEQARDRVLDTIEQTRRELITFLGEYVRFQSVNPEMVPEGTSTELRQCQEWLRDRLHSWGIFDEVRCLVEDPEQPNVVARRRGQGNGPALLFNGHSDVVPVTPDQEAAWSVGSPWGGAVIDGKLWGRGASDMKGGNAAFLWAIKALAAAGVRLRGDLLATVVSGEETGHHTIGVDLLAAEGYVAPFGILTEPTDLQVCPATVGEFYFLIRVQGRSASLASRHLAVYPAPYGVPVAGVNAIEKMLKIQRALVDLDREWGVWQRHPLMVPGNMNINFSRIHGGDIYSAIADGCELTGSVLFNPSLSFEQVLAEFRRAIDGAVQSDYWLREHPPTITVPYILDQKEPINLSPGHPGCKALIDAYEEVMQTSPTLICTTGTSDGNYLAARGQAIVTFGPGASNAGVHGSNEHVDVDRLVDATKVIALTAMEWCEIAALD